MLPARQFVFFAPSNFWAGMSLQCPSFNSVANAATATPASCWSISGSCMKARRNAHTSTEAPEIEGARSNLAFDLRPAQSIGRSIDSLNDLIG